jgi:tetratricopeptide (TPR) repeat protein
LPGPRDLAADPDMLTAELNLGLSAMTNMGLSLMCQEKYEEAIQCFKKNEKEFAATYYNMGLALYRAKRCREALDYFRRACAIEPNDAEFLNLLRQTYDRLGK